MLKTRQQLPLAALLWLAALLIGGKNSAFDLQILSALRLPDSSSLVPVTLFVTHLGGWMVLSVISLAVTICLMVHRRTNDALFLIVATYGGRALVELQKLALERPRPAEHPLIEISSMSFPSGHAANALITYLVLALLFKSQVGVAAALLLCLMIGISRVMLGVHWATDILGGWAFAIFWIALLRCALQRRAPDA